MKTKILADPLKDAELTDDILHLIAKYGLVNDIVLRNSQIRKERLESKERGERLQDFMSRAADKYSLSEKTIDAIIYHSHKYKNN